MSKEQYGQCAQTTALGPRGILVHSDSYFITVRRAVAVVTIVKWLRFSHWYVEIKRDRSVIGTVVATFKLFIDLCIYY